MFSDKKQINAIDARFILCSLLTLQPHNPFFKRFNIKSSLSGDCNNQTQTCIILSLNNNEILLDLRESLKSSSIRQLAKDIINPIGVRKQSKRGLYNQQNYKYILVQTTVLKKYLAKFKYFYKLYFTLHNIDVLAPINDKELNYFAIYSLFLIIGI